MSRSVFVVPLMAAVVASCSAKDATVAPPSPPKPRDAILEPRPIAPPAPVVRKPERRVVLVTIDGVRWQDVVAPSAERDLMPKIYERVAEGGVILGASDEAGCGQVRATSGSNVSLPGYMEILTGRPTGCTHNYCPPVRQPTVLDAAAESGIRPVASIGSWETLGRAVSASARASHVFVSTGSGRWPDARPLPDPELEKLVEQGEHARPFPAQGGRYRPDRLTGAIALEYYRSMHPRLLHVGLGDTDEYAHRANHAGYIESLRQADSVVGALADAAEEEGALASTTFLVTTDHGRGANFRDHGPGHPGSARSFLIAFGGGVRGAGVTCPHRDLRLADVGATVRALLELPADPASDAGAPIDAIVMR